MEDQILAKPAVVQRRSSIADVQAALDGTILIGLCYFLITQHVGVLTAEYTVFVLLLLCALGFFYDAFGIYRRNTNFTRKAIDLLESWALAFSVMFALGIATKLSEVFSRLLLAQLFVLGYLSQLATRALIRAAYQEVLRHSSEVNNVIIVGSGQLAMYLNHRIESSDWLGQHVVGYVELGREAAPTAPQSTFGKSPHCLGRLEQLIELIALHKIRTVYFAIPLNASEILETLYFRLLDKHVAVHWVPDIFSLRLVNHTVSEIAGLPVLTLSETPLIGTRRLLKLAEDCLLSVLLLIPLVPLMLLIAIAVRLDSPGPVFFRQARLGWGGKRFRIWKFRSMYVHDDDGRLAQARQGDPRVTRVGRFLRRTSLDELPQIFNVLAGEMSLVGPRPHAVQHDVEYAQHIAHYFARQNIKPGITGLAQVRGHRGETRSIELMMLRVESDIEYINNWSVWLDLSILVRTTRAFTGRNAY
ncbi:MAG: undecaprenyl-phosphate glucose phosphotransferase [Ramlibacter sp.]|jgi:putative colanic acid biosynthesis UDP-glucose lipid carrier transferase|nr:undecaprenyl-phosphate glucose phosphotransferase [Ramlibacter sp.]MDB5912870.1 undecaprenyl-phosphate glucose phosphotransferase [Ramlibacter sp.]